MYTKIRETNFPGDMGKEINTFGIKSSNYRTTQLDSTPGQCLHFTDENAKKQRHADTRPGPKANYEESQD